jgi:hypothetical protein
MAMSTPRGERLKGRGGLVVAVLILVMLVGYALYMYFGRGGGGGGGITTTTPGPSPPPTVLYPREIVNGFDLILIEDHVTSDNGRYSVVASAVGSYRSVVAYGGSSVSGNITNGIAVIKYGGYDILVVAFASTNSTITQDFPGIQVRLDENGGYVFYTPISMAIYYRRHMFNVSNTVVYVWVPAKTLPTRLASASVHVTIDPVHGVYYMNNVAYSLERGTPPQKFKGVLRSWLVYTETGGRYVFTINP